MLLACLLAVLLVPSTLSSPTVLPNVTLQAKGWDILTADNKSSFLHLIHDGEKSYYFSVNILLNYFQAAQFCSDIHMQLVSVESKEENDLLYNHVRNIGKSDKYWTSGARILDGKHWIWMTKGKPVEFSKWGANQPDTTTELCMEVFHKKNEGLYWNDRDCLAASYFICENSARENNFDVRSSVACDTATLYHNPYVSPAVPLLYVGDKSIYLNRYFKATFQEAMQLCQMMDMELLTIASKEENEAIYKYIRDTNAGDFFWTSATRSIDGITWIWMSTAELVHYTNWYTDQPNTAVEMCLVVQNRKGEGMFWHDAPCANRYLYMCQKSRADDGFTLKAQKDEGSSQRVLEGGNSDEIRLNGKTFYLGTEFRATRLKAMQFCHSRNMQLVSIETAEDQEIVRKLIHQYTELPGSGFWTSAYKEDIWSWATDVPLKYTNWKEGEPNNVGKKEFCMEIYNNEAATWNDITCYAQRNFICEKVEPQRQGWKNGEGTKTVNIFVNVQSKDLVGQLESKGALCKQNVSSPKSIEDVIKFAEDPLTEK